MYGKFIFNHIDNIINVTNTLENIQIGCYNEYPSLKTQDIKYFDITKLN